MNYQKQKRTSNIPLPYRTSTSSASVWRTVGRQTAFLRSRLEAGEIADLCLSNPAFCDKSSAQSSAGMFVKVPRSGIWRQLIHWCRRRRHDVDVAGVAKGREARGVVLDVKRWRAYLVTGPHPAMQDTIDPSRVQSLLWSSLMDVFSKVAVRIIRHWLNYFSHAHVQVSLVLYAVTISRAVETAHTVQGLLSTHMLKQLRSTVWPEIVLTVVNNCEYCGPAHGDTPYGEFHHKTTTCVQPGGGNKFVGYISHWGKGILPLQWRCRCCGNVQRQSAAIEGAAHVELEHGSSTGGSMTPWATLRREVYFSAAAVCGNKQRQIFRCGNLRHFAAAKFALAAANQCLCSGNSTSTAAIFLFSAANNIFKLSTRFLLPSTPPSSGITTTVRAKPSPI
ncbi:hypothetical protein C8R45DRAFT_921646 [Mycena sanguinolenta]|nr:hypothetical protein C8R45DRAFT_921646 [Mycena sanguinolenta]